jgi:hypothetical protein
VHEALLDAQRHCGEAEGRASLMQAQMKVPILACKPHPCTILCLAFQSFHMPCTTGTAAAAQARLLLMSLDSCPASQAPQRRSPGCSFLLKSLVWVRAAGDARAGAAAAREAR